jgi:hypothetical protein
MLWLTEDAVIVCKHEMGKVRLAPIQALVTIGGRRVLVENDPEGRPVAGCPNIGIAIKPCQHTLKVSEGYSDFLKIDGRKVCLETVTGLTDGTPPGVVKYKVRTPGQDLVFEAK